MNLSTIINWVLQNPSQILTYVGGGAGLSVALETLLTKYHINSKKVAFTLLHVFTVLTSLVALYFGASGKQAVGSFAALTILAQIWHRFAVSPANKKYVTPFLNYLSNQKTTSTPKVTAQTATMTPAYPSLQPTTSSVAQSVVTPAIVK